MRAVSHGQGALIPAWERPILSWLCPIKASLAPDPVKGEGSGAPNGHKQPFIKQRRCMSAAVGILRSTSFFCHDPWDYLCGEGGEVGA